MGNIAVGRLAGNNLTTGDNNIMIGNEGVAGDRGRIRIGTSETHTTTHLTGDVLITRQSAATVSQVEAAVPSLQATVANQAAQIATLQNQLAALQAAFGQHQQHQ